MSLNCADDFAFLYDSFDGALHFLVFCLMVDGELLEDSHCGVAFIGSNMGASFF